MGRGLLYAALAILYLLHNDLWLWDASHLVAGLPAGLAYHLGYCFAVAALMALAVRFGWPVEPDEPAAVPPGDDDPGRLP